jgi:fatty-acyl-CoA synthase
MYISGGENVYPVEVEDVLLHMPEIEQVAVVGVPDEKWGETGCAAVVARYGSVVTMEKITSFCATRLARFKIPRYLVLLEQLPRNSTGKINKLLVRQSVSDLLT